MIERLLAKKNIRRLGWLVVVAITLFVLFHVVENFRGAKAWAAAVEQLRAEGETVDFDALLPEPVAAADNFGAIPILEGIMSVVGGDPPEGGPGERRARIEAIWERVFRQSTEDLPALSSFPVSTLDEVDLNAWASYFREHTDLKLPADTTLPAGEVILAGLAEFDPIIDQLTAALDRPHAQLVPGMEQYRGVEDPFTITLPHLSSLQTLTKLLALRAHALLGIGDAERALQAILATLRVAELSGDGGMLIGTLVYVAQLNLVQSPIWSALKDRQFGASELEELQRRLEGLDPIESYGGAVRFELAGVSRALATAKARGGLSGIMQMMAGTDSGSGGGVAVLLSRLAPKGWIDQNRATLARVYWEYELEPIRDGSIVEAKAKLEEMLVAEGGKGGLPSPYSFLVQMTMPSIAKVFQPVAKTRAFLDLQICAIALERYHLEEGAYPEALDALVPEYLSEVPIDIMSNAPLHYSLTPDGRYRIYSVAWDEVDSGGEIVTMENGSIDRFAGDWVWQYGAVGQPEP